METNQRASGQLWSPQLPALPFHIQLIHPADFMFRGNFLTTQADRGLKGSVGVGGVNMPSYVLPRPWPLLKQ